MGVHGLNRLLRGCESTDASPLFYKARSEGLVEGRHDEYEAGVSNVKIHDEATESDKQ